MNAKMIFLIIFFTLYLKSMEPQPNKFCRHKEPKQYSGPHCPQSLPVCVKYQSICFKEMKPYVGGAINQHCTKYSMPGYPAGLVTIHNVYCPMPKWSEANVEKPQWK